MAKTDNLTDFLTSLANKIREHTGDTGTINPQDFENKIESIASSSGGGGNNGFPVSVTAEYANAYPNQGSCRFILSDGTNITYRNKDLDDFTPTIVNNVIGITMPAGGGITLSSGSAIAMNRTSENTRKVEGIPGVSEPWILNAEIIFLLEPCTIDYKFFCLTGDTLITLSDNTQKRIDQLTTQDKILSYNPITLKLEADSITYTDSQENKDYTEYDIWKFSNGSQIKTVHRHRFYNIEHQQMMYMDEWNIGEHGLTIDGKEIELLSHENVKEKVKHYTIFTKNQNYFANGILSGNRYTLPMRLRGEN